MFSTYVISTYCNREDGILFITEAENEKEALINLLAKCKEDFNNDFVVHYFGDEIILSSSGKVHLVKIGKVDDSGFALNLHALKQ